MMHILGAPILKYAKCHMNAPVFLVKVNLSHHPPACLSDNAAPHTARHTVADHSLMLVGKGWLRLTTPLSLSHYILYIATMGHHAIVDVYNN